MAAAKGIPPPASMDTHGDMKTNWKFFNYETATELDTKDEKIRIATLLSVMCKDCFQIYQHLDITEANRKVLAEVLRALQEQFEPRTNVIYERYVFNITDQTNETVDSYITRLRKISDSSEFGGLKDDMIGDRLVLGTKDGGARSRMLREPKLTLAKAIDVCRTSEMTELQMKKFNLDDKVHVVDKHRTFKKNAEHSQQSTRNSGQKNLRDKKQYGKPAPARQDYRKGCKYCGGQHARDQHKCPAFGQTCNNCKKSNHFSKMCLMKKIHAVEDDDTDTDESLFRINETLLNVTKTKGRQYFTTLRMKVGTNSRKVKCQLDTGATYNLLSMRIFKILHKGDVKLSHSDTKLSLYEKSHIYPKGKVRIECSVGDYQRNLEFQVVDADQPTILSGDAREALGLINY